MTNEELVALIKEGGNQQEYMTALWEQNKGFVARMAHKYGPFAEIEDLMQEGYLALCDAIEKYDPEMGVQFLTFASYCIRTRYMRYVSQQGSIRLPEAEYRMTNKYERAVSELWKANGRMPTREEIRDALGIADQEFAKVERNMSFREIASVEQPVSSHNESILADIIADSHNEIAEVEDRIAYEELQEVLWGLADTLDSDQSAVLHAMYQEGKAVQDISDRMGISSNKTYSIHEAGLRALRSGRRARELLPLYNEYIYNVAVRGISSSSFNRTWTSSTERVALWTL